MFKRKNVLLLIFVLSAVLSGCSKEKEKKNYFFAINPHSDFFITQVSKYEQLPDWKPAEDCKANIQAVLCVVSEPSENLINRPCSSDNKPYVKAFEEAYEALDPINQKMFCHLRHLYLEESFYATGYASQAIRLTEEGYEQLPGAIIGVRKSILDTPVSLTKWATWKDQLNFVKLEHGDEAPLAYPKYTSNEELSLLEYVLVHEIGHIMDFSNRLSSDNLERPECFKEPINSVEDYIEKCGPHSAPESWGALSWKNYAQVKPENDFFGRSKLCFYNCETTMNPAVDVVPFYQGLKESVFVSTYASFAVQEDFAESWATEWLINWKQSDYKIHGSDSLSFSVRETYLSDRFSAKRKFIEDFKKTEIQYPGDIDHMR